MKLGQLRRLASVCLATGLLVGCDWRLSPIDRAVRFTYDNRLDEDVQIAYKEYWYDGIVADSGGVLVPAHSVRQESVTIRFWWLGIRAFATSSKKVVFDKLLTENELAQGDQPTIIIESQRQDVTASSLSQRTTGVVESSALENLRLIEQLLVTYGDQGQAEVVGDLVSLGESGDPAFYEKFASVDMWGGSGAVWEVPSFRNESKDGYADEVRFRNAIITLAEYMNKERIGSETARARARSIGSTFRYWNEKGF